MFWIKILNVTKQARFATFAITIKDTLCFILHQYKWNQSKYDYRDWSLHAPYTKNLMTIRNFFISRWKSWSLSRAYFGSWEHALVAIAVVKRFEQEPIYELSTWPLWRDGC